MGLEDLIREMSSNPTFQKQMQLAQEMFHNASGSENFLTNLLLTLPMGITVFRSIFRRELKSALEEQGIEIREVMDEVLKQRKQEPRQTFMQKNWPALVSAAIVLPTYSSIIYSKLEPHVSEGKPFDPLGFIWYAFALTSTYFAYPFFKLMASAFEPGKIKGNLSYLAAALLDKPLIRKASLKFYENYAELSDTNLAHRALARVYFRFSRPEDAMNELYAAMERKNAGKSKFEEILDKEGIAELRDLYTVFTSQIRRYNPPVEKRANNYFFCSLVAEDLGLSTMAIRCAEDAVKYAKKTSPEAHLFKSTLHERAGQRKEQIKELKKAIQLMTERGEYLSSLRSISGYDVYELPNSPLLQHSVVFKKKDRASLLREIEMTKTAEKLVLESELDKLGLKSAEFVGLLELDELFGVFRYAKGQTLYNSDQQYVIPTAGFLGAFHAIMPFSPDDLPDIGFSFKSFKQKLMTSGIASNLKSAILDNYEFCFKGIDRIKLVVNKDSHQHNWIISENEEVTMIDIEPKGLTDPASELCKLIYHSKEYNQGSAPEAINKYIAAFNSLAENTSEINIKDSEMEMLVLCRTALRAISYYCCAENMTHLREPSLNFLKSARQAYVELERFGNELSKRENQQRKNIEKCLDKLLPASC